MYLALFGIAVILTAVAVVSAVTDSAQRVVRQELQASGEVYGQIWASRSAQLRQGAAILAHDYGFREAVATNDEATVRSALDNLRARQQVDGAMIMGVDGYATASGLGVDDAALDTLYNGLGSGDVDAGVLAIGDQSYQVVAAPVMAPVLIGWVVFIERLDAAQMQTLERLSAIPLSATLSRSGALTKGPALVDGPDGRTMRLERALPSFDTDAPATLVLSYPLKRALKPYDTLFLALAVIALIGVLGVASGAWMLARSVTRPISDLDQAVHRIQQGDYAEAVVDSNDEIGRLASSFNAMVGDLRDREARLTHMALHDQETGLPNRLALEREIARAGSWVILIGVDRFGVVRNAIGYDSMAVVLAALGQRIAAELSGAQVARIGPALGVSIEAASAEEALAIATDLIEKVQAPVRIEGATVDVALTAGVAPRDAGKTELASPIDRAAIAVDQARTGHRSVALFDRSAYGDPSGNLSLISELMSALARGEVSLAYQPKFDFRADRINGVEALMRWSHPERGFVSPDLFIGMAEETGHIRPLTEWAIRRAIDDQIALAEAGHDLAMSVNISGRLLSDESFADFALEEARRAVGGLCFEITETAVMSNPETALRIVERFSEAGIRVSLDDYGSGLSSLAYLKQIRADELKIDKAFIMGLDQSSRDALLVKSTIDLAHGLGLRIVAEGVETETALVLLRGMGCDMAQGYFIGRPMPLAALTEMLQPAAKTAPTCRLRTAA